ncbi:single-stranded-DNA-specific exonuclease RecJ [Candidatus Falkowbacteria bacterium]|nr:single-stranded-DNA-specific exonuclease RecJ [Candidatus Falkowbacteria bacterium]
MSKLWQVSSAAPKEFTDKFPEINPVVLQLLYHRGLDTQEKIDEFFNPDYEGDIHDPLLFADMAKAVERIFTAIQTGQKVMVHGDYDADGVTSSVIMVSVLKKLAAVFGPAGEAADDHIDIFIPHRELDGYGLKEKNILEFAKAGVSLVITVDCATSNVREVQLASEQGMEVIITDHHQAGHTLPAAYAMINPNVPGEPYPFKFLSGAGVAFKVAQALIHQAKTKAPKENWEAFEKWLLDLVAIGIVADVMPLLGENRTLVKYGLVVLNKTSRLGLRALLFKAGIGGNGRMANGLRDLLPKAGLNTYSIAFQIGPRLNAAGRMDHANTAYGLLMTTDPAEAETLSDQIQESNTARQTLTETIMRTAAPACQEQVTANHQLLVIYGNDWPTGVLGLVAGKLMDQFGRPVIVASFYQGKVVASGRSLPQFDLFVALGQQEKYFTNFGGHPAACGFTLQDPQSVEAFQRDIQAAADAQLAGVQFGALLEIAAEIDLAAITWGLYDELEKMEPFGEANRRPLFLLRQLAVDGVEPLGKDQTHLKLMVKQANGLVRKLIGFGLASSFGHLRRGDHVDAVVEVGVNEWNGNRELQMKVVDMKMSG